MTENPVGEQQPVVSSQNSTPPVQPQHESEKLVPQSKVNEIVGNTLERGRQQGYQQAKNEIQSNGNVPHGTTQADFQRIAEETFARKHAEMQQAMLQEQQRREGERVLNELRAKEAEAKTRIPDYDQKISPLKLETMPEVLWYANTVDNSADVLYDLANNPAKIGALRALPPHLAALEMKRLSDSIKTNQDSSASKMPPDPLSQIKPGNQGNDKQVKTASDYRTKYRGVG